MDTTNIFNIESGTPSNKEYEPNELNNKVTSIEDKRKKKKPLVEHMDYIESISDDSLNSHIGQLVKLGIERGRKTRDNLKIGVCGEHGGDPESVKFFAEAGLNYVSCSPYRVPVARLAAAQAALLGKGTKAKKKTKK